MGLLVPIMLCVCGCSTDEPAAHAVVGIWGVRTQSGELVPAFEFGRDGTCQVLDPAGTGLPAGVGEYSELDSTRVRCSLSSSADGDEIDVVFEVDGGSLVLTAAGEVYRGFERMGND